MNKKVQNYLQSGGLFNPEFMEHTKVRDLIIELNTNLSEAIEIIEMVEDNRKMPHQHDDYYTRLCCLSEQAREFLEKYKK